MAADLDSTWASAARRFRAQGMSEAEVERQRAAWFTQRRPATAGSTLRGALGGGTAGSAADVIARRRRVEDSIK